MSSEESMPQSSLLRIPLRLTQPVYAATLAPIFFTVDLSK